MPAAPTAASIPSASSTSRQQPPRIVDRGGGGRCGPEGLAISPKGDVAVAVILAGSNNRPAYFHRTATVRLPVLRSRRQEGDEDQGHRASAGCPEAAVFTPDGRYLLVGNYLDQDFSILRVNGTTITDTGKALQGAGPSGLCAHEPARAVDAGRATE